MKISRHDDGSFTLKCDRSELSILSNALNNIPQAVHEQEYTSLIGATKADATVLLDQCVAALGG